MASKIVIILALVTILVLGVLDVNYFGHYGDGLFERRAQKALQTAGYNDDWNDPISTPVEDGLISLEGPVPTEEDRSRVADAVRRHVPGIRGVMNNLRTHEEICEEQVLEGLKELVGSGEAEARISYIIAPPCDITLTGWVPTEGMRAGIEKMASASPGVTHIINNIEVGQPKKKLQDTLIEILRIHNIYFDFNKATIRDESAPALNEIAAALKEHRDYRVRIEGHTDSIGTDAYNQDLSQRRAQAVVDALVARGVPAERLEAVGYGEARPIATNETPEGRAENRRIEFKVLEATDAGAETTVAERTSS